MHPIFRLQLLQVRRNRHGTARRARRIAGTP
jgi:hypothetical protein